MAWPWFLVARYVSFALSIAFNAVICIIAAYNLDLAEGDTQIFSYLIALSVLSIVTVFPIAFLDIVDKRALTSRVLFELCWISLLWVMQLAGAAAASANVADYVCLISQSDSSQSFSRATCRADSVLVAFTWLTMTLFLVHLFGLLIAALSHHSLFPNIWFTGVREIPWFEHKHIAPSSAFVKQERTNQHNSPLNVARPPSAPLQRPPRTRASPPLQSAPPIPLPIYAQRRTVAGPSRHHQQQSSIYPFSSSSAAQRSSDYDHNRNYGRSQVEMTVEMYRPQPQAAQPLAPSAPGRYRVMNYAEEDSIRDFDDTLTRTREDPFKPRAGPDPPPKQVPPIPIPHQALSLYPEHIRASLYPQQSQTVPQITSSLPNPPPSSHARRPLPKPPLTPAQELASRVRAMDQGRSREIEVENAPFQPSGSKPEVVEEDGRSRSRSRPKSKPPALNLERARNYSS